MRKVRSTKQYMHQHTCRLAHVLLAPQRHTAAAHTAPSASPAAPAASATRASPHSTKPLALPQGLPPKAFPPTLAPAKGTDGGAALDWLCSRARRRATSAVSACARACSASSARATLGDAAAASAHAGHTSCWRCNVMNTKNYCLMLGHALKSPRNIENSGQTACNAHLNKTQS